MDSDPNLNRIGTDVDVKAIKEAFIDKHKFNSDLTLDKKVTVDGVQSSMKSYVKRLVASMPKFIVIFIMTHGKKNNW